MDNSLKAKMVLNFAKFLIIESPQSTNVTTSCLCVDISTKRQERQQFESKKLHAIVLLT